MTDPTPRFPVGTVYYTHRRVRRIQESTKHTVVDFWVTRNLAGEVVRTRYVTTHVFLGQVVHDYDVVETTIARGIPS